MVHNPPSGGDPFKEAMNGCRDARRAFKKVDECRDKLKKVEEDRLMGKEVSFRAQAALSAADDAMRELWERLAYASEMCSNISNDRGRRETCRSTAQRPHASPYADESNWPRSKELACPSCRTLVCVGPEIGEYYCPRCDRMVETPAHDPYMSKYRIKGFI